MGGVRPDGSSQGGYLVYASSHALHAGQEAPVGIIEWKSWKCLESVEVVYQPSHKRWPTRSTF